MKFKKIAALSLAFVTTFTMPVHTAFVFADNGVYLNEVKEMAVDVDFTTMNEVPVYSKENGQGFVSASSAIMPDGLERKVSDTSKIAISSANGAEVTESNGEYLINKGKDNYNYGGLIYRVDTGAPGAYKIEVEVIGTKDDTQIALTGMNADRLTMTGFWDDAKLVERTASAKWEGSKWSYDFATGESFIEIEIEPKTLATTAKPQTVGVKSIKVTSIPVNAKEGKPTIHILGDSTQKSYTFQEVLNGWGQTLVDYFDTDKVNVINYSMGGHSMKNNYNNGRFDEVLMKGKEGDFVFIHSAHNDETSATDDKEIRFGRGTQMDTLAKGTALYNRWLDMYVDAIRARGMTPVLVTPMPRVNGGTGKWSENENKPNGFNPDSTGSMRIKAATSEDIGLIELYDGAKDYLSSIDGEEVRAIWNQNEAGELPGGYGGSTANGGKSDGTHFKESASRQWCRIMLQSIYDQSVAQTDTYKDKAIMSELIGYVKKDVSDSVKTGDWSKVFPEMASDVSAVGIIPGAEKQPKDNYYYRNSIEKVLSLGIMKKGNDNKFLPVNTISVGEFARSVEKAFGLAENSLTSYTKTYAELKASGATEIGGETTDDASISNVEISGGNTVVTLKNIESGIVVAVKHNGKKVESMKKADVSGKVVTLEGIAADTVYVWDSLESMKPLCKAFEVPGTAAENAETKADDVALAANGEFTVSVTQNEGGKVTIYNESDYANETVDIVNGGVTSKMEISDNSYFKLTAPETIVNKNDSGGVFADNKAISTGYIEIRNDDLTKHIVYNAKESGKVIVYLRHDGAKLVTCENKTDSKSEQKYMNGTTTAGSKGNVYAGVEFTVESGKEYEIYTNGGTGRLFGVQFTTEQETSTESLSVNNGTKVKVVAERENAQWILNSIIVNGEKVTKKGEKEYTFTVSGNTTVSAEFLANPEPTLVETTLIASDAPLTREAMAAVLYDAYLLKFGKGSDGSWNKPDYMTKYNGAMVSPDSPNYDPNIVYEGNVYYPLRGWDAVKDIDTINKALYGKAKEVYNLGLMRADTTVARGSASNGENFEPKTEVTRARAAKALGFIYVLTQPVDGENQVLPNGNLAGETAEIIAPNRGALTVPMEIR